MFTLALPLLLPPLPAPTVVRSPTSPSSLLLQHASPAWQTACPQQRWAAVLPLPPPMPLLRTTTTTKTTAAKQPRHKWGILAATVRCTGPSHSVIPHSSSSLMFKILHLMRNSLNITLKKDLMRRRCLCHRFCCNRCHNCRHCL